MRQSQQQGQNNDISDFTPLLYEHGIERVNVYPVSSLTDFLSKAPVFIHTLDKKEQVDIINSYPSIGECTKNLSAASAAEQGMSGAKDEQEEAEISAMLERLNEEYGQKFGHQFVTFVNGRSRKVIIPELRTRLACSNDEELRRCLDQVVLIVQSRCKKLLQL